MQIFLANIIFFPYLCTRFQKKDTTMVEIREVKNKWQLYKFIKFGNDLYKDDPNFCPHLILDEFNTFDLNHNPAHRVCEQILYLAYREGKIVGRIAGIINHAANEKWGVRHVRFGWIDFIDDLEVSKALLDAVAAWGKSKGMDAINGPVGFTDFDYEGLLVEGYEYKSPLVTLYNYPYYVQHMEAYGLTKEADWIEFEVYPPTELPEKMSRVAKIAAQRSKVHVDKVKSAKELKDKYGLEPLDVIDEAYQKLYNFQPLSKEQKEFFCQQYFPMLNFDFCTIVVNEQNEVVGVGVGMPDISDAVRKCRGRLFPTGWYHILKALKAKQMDSFTLLLIAVRPDYQGKGVNAVIFDDQLPYFQQYGIKRVDTTSILESNWQNQANWTILPHKQHKRRRAYIKGI